MNFEPTPEQKQIQAQARQFAETEVIPIAREADEKREFPLHLVRRMGELGFLGGPLEPEYGGAGMGHLSCRARWVAQARAGWLTAAAPVALERRHHRRRLWLPLLKLKTVAAF